MATPTTVDEAIDTNARGPKKVKRNGSEVEYHSIQDQIAAAKWAQEELAKDAAGLKGHFGMRFTKLIPPGGG